MELSIESLWRTTYHYILLLVALLVALYAIGWSIERVLQLFTVFFLAMLTSSILIMNRDMKGEFNALKDILKKISNPLSEREKQEVKTTGAGALSGMMIGGLIGLLGGLIGVIIGGIIGDQIEYNQELERRKAGVQQLKAL
jgi:TRAP-type uncharacterized transport system fused permease subunit